MTWRDPRAGPPGERSSWAVRLEAMRHVWPVVLLFLVVIGGIYAGVFTTGGLTLRHLTMGTMFRGVTPFNVALVALLAIVVAFPELSTFLPRFMK